MMNRYIRQLALPEMDPQKQETLKNSTVFLVGAGGLGAASLPYLAGAGIGHIIVADNDRVDISNLHRQIIFRADQAGQSKATCAGSFLRALNPDIQVHIINERIDEKNAIELLSARHVDLILDGSDNFKTKDLLNKVSIAMKVPLITASVSQFFGQIGSFEGYNPERACYRCLFPELPDVACDCNDAGILGTSAGIIGLIQAHIALCRLLDIKISHEPGHPFTRVNLKTLKIEHYVLPKDPNCPHCAALTKKEKTTETTKDEKLGWGVKQDISLAIQPKNNDDKPKEPEKPKISIQTIEAEPKEVATKDDKAKEAIQAPEIHSISIHNLNDEKSLIVDVRQPEEVESDPIEHPLIMQRPRNIPLPELSARLDELPRDKRITFICSKNMRSIQAAQYALSKGFENVCILDRFSL